jgi:hypothetical protein
VEDTKYKEFFLKERIDTRPFFDDLMKNQKSVLISKDQANLFNRISGNDNMVEVISRDIATDVHKIWKAYSLGLLTFGTCKKKMESLPYTWVW